MEDELRPEDNLPELLKNGVRGKYAESYQTNYFVRIELPHAVEQAFLMMTL